MPGMDQFVNEPQRRRARRSAADDPSDEPDGGSLVELLLATDPVPPEVLEAAKAAFTRHQPTATVLPMIVDLREGEAFDDDVDQGPEPLVFGDAGSPVEVAVEAEVVNRALTLRCAIRTEGVEPTAVVAESPIAQYPLPRLSEGMYGAGAFRPARCGSSSSSPAGRTARSSRVGSLRDPSGPVRSVISSSCRGGRPVPPAARRTGAPRLDGAASPQLP